MNYSTKEVTQKSGLSMHTLRYYEKQRLLPPIQRDLNGTREYSDADLEWFILIRCMRAAGMSIEYIRNYIDLCKQGPSTISERKDIILLQKKILEEQKRKVEENLRMIELKIKYYQELEGKEPQESAEILAQAHVRMKELLEK